MEEIINKASEAWLQTNASLFKHVLDYEAKLNAFLDKAGGWIRVQEECIWMTMFQITGDIGAPLCASLDIACSISWTHSPLFWQTSRTRAIHPSSAGFVPEAYAQPWLGLHSLGLAHTLPLNSHRKAEDVLKEAIIHSTGGGAATTVGQVHLPPPPQHPHRSREMLKHSHWVVFPPLLPPQYALHPSADVPSPLLHNAYGLAPLLVRVWHLSADQERVI